MSRRDYHPELQTDGKYLTKIADGTPTIAELMDIDFLKLSEALATFALEDLYQYVSKDAIDIARVKAVLDILFTKIVAGSLNDEQRQKLDVLWDYLAVDDSNHLKPADIIFVFGGPEEVKAHKAAELFKAGLAPLIIFTGDTQKALVATPHTSESVRDAEIAMRLGVPRAAILIENTSINTPQNVLNARAILAKRQPFPRRYILVNLPWYLRRATNTFITNWHQAPEPALSIQKVSVDSTRFTRKDYHLDRQGLEYVVFEYLKLKQARAMGHM
ncbi:MAG: YdcF family protein [Candidatus Abawacabacteria bacterium]|nr:YdcF family protein [Candidatus Abawacabacteria bacterium]